MKLTKTQQASLERIQKFGLQVSFLTGSKEINSAYIVGGTEKINKTTTQKLIESGLIEESTKIDSLSGIEKYIYTATSAPEFLN